MAAVSTITGRFAALRHKTWPDFTDERTGEIVKAGQSLIFWTVDDDGELDEVKVPAERVPLVLESVKALTFGDRVTMGVKVTKYANNLVGSVDKQQPVRAAS